MPKKYQLSDTKTAKKYQLGDTKMRKRYQLGDTFLKLFFLITFLKNSYEKKAGLFPVLLLPFCQVYYLFLLSDGLVNKVTRTAEMVVGIAYHHIGQFQHQVVSS